MVLFLKTGVIYSVIIVMLFVTGWTLKELNLKTITVDKVLAQQPSEEGQSEFMLLKVKETTTTEEVLKNSENDKPSQVDEVIKEAETNGTKDNVSKTEAEKMFYLNPAKDTHKNNLVTETQLVEQLKDFQESMGF